ncbi:cell division ATP-binding protein FtsE [Emcibacter nanhaiensis]|uniref:Cell division ATP-binding protein FtsE n=1 Tax=Emcibacter nanhaiensis TaxID=1505037 RepID=A0A501PMD7_9PROT|nr:cell division ATP-binding protein FtsE [Emcibacter nanhaiensis]TPD61659.1 cell division ATP-binding protein FtsE [Emcibacter nanhaiensis]
MLCQKLQRRKGQEVIRFENVGMRYGMGSEVLKDISFDLEPGSLHFLTGPSGAGKTSLLRLMYLAHRPSRGTISMFNQDVSATERKGLPRLRRRIGVVFQDFRLLDHLTAVENVALPLRIAGGKGKEIDEHVEELLAWVGLKDRMAARPSTLSGGEKQRVAIARAVINRPDLLLADEPTGNVDPEMAERLMYLFVELNKLGTTTVIATHDMSLVRKIGADRMHLHDGHLQMVRAGETPLSPVGEN